MKVAILAGGVGTRLAEETEVRPKPMVEIGGKPILWHIMKHYDHYGFKEFVIALGYKGEYIKRYMVDYCSLEQRPHRGPPDRQRAAARRRRRPDWKVELIDTGQQTNTGGRIKRLAPYLGDETFMLTWGDGVSDVDLDELLEFHRSHGKLATVTAVRPPARFGALDIERRPGRRSSPRSRRSARAGSTAPSSCCEPGVFDYIEGDETQFEKEPLETLAADGQLMAYRHDGFWQCMDTLRDKYLLERPVGVGQGALEDLEGLRCAFSSPATTATSAPCSSRCSRRAGHEVVGLDSDLFAECVFGQRRPPESSRCARTSATSRSRRPARLRRRHPPGGDLQRSAGRPEPALHLRHQPPWRRSVWPSCAKEAGVAALPLLVLLQHLRGVEPGRRAATRRRPSTRSRPTASRRSASSRTSPSWPTTTSARPSCATRRPTASPPRLRGDLVVNNLVGWAFTTGEVCIKSDGTPWRPLVHIEDISRAFLAVLEAPREVVHNEAFNVGRSQENYRIREVADLVEEIVEGSQVTLRGGRRPRQALLPGRLRQDRGDCCPRYQPQLDRAPRASRSSTRPTARWSSSRRTSRAAATCASSTSWS